MVAALVVRIGAPVHHDTGNRGDGRAWEGRRQRRHRGLILVKVASRGPR